MKGQIRLKTGEWMPDMIVWSVMQSLRALMEENALALYMLMEKCRRPEFNLAGSIFELLRDRELLQQDGQPHDAVKQIALSSIEYDEATSDITLVAPAHEDQTPSAEDLELLDDEADETVYPCESEVS